MLIPTHQTVKIELLEITPDTVIICISVVIISYWAMLLDIRGNFKNTVSRNMAGGEERKEEGVEIAPGFCSYAGILNYIKLQ